MMELFNTALMITGLVLVMLLLIDYLNVLSAPSERGSRRARFALEEKL